LKEGEYLLTVEAKIQFETPDSMEGGTPTFGKPVSFLARNVPLIISSESSPRE
jgi:hypothetical protein